MSKLNPALFRSNASLQFSSLTNDQRAQFQAWISEIDMVTISRHLDDTDINMFSDYNDICLDHIDESPQLFMEDKF